MTDESDNESAKLHEYVEKIVRNLGGFPSVVSAILIVRREDGEHLIERSARSDSHEQARAEILTLVNSAARVLMLEEKRFHKPPGALQ